MHSRLGALVVWLGLHTMAVVAAGAKEVSWIVPSDCTDLLEATQTKYLHFAMTNKPPILHSTVPRPMYKCAVESALQYLDTGRVIIVWTNTYDASEWDFLDNKHGQIRFCNPTDVWRKGTPLESWNNTGKYTSANAANAWRLLITYKLGGMYLDFDIITMSRSLFLQNTNLHTITWETSTFYNGAYMNFPERHDPLLLALMEEFVAGFNGDKWGNNGPRLMDRVIKPCLSAGRPLCDKLLVSAESRMAPYHFNDIPRALNVTGTTSRVVHETWTEAKLWALHWYSSRWYSKTPPCMMPLSLMHRVFKQACPRTLAHHDLVCA